MKVIGLEIKKPESWESKSDYRGVVRLEGESGKQELVLSARMMSKIFLLIQSEVAATAARNAAATNEAMEEAAATVQLLESAGHPALPSDL